MNRNTAPFGVFWEASGWAASFRMRKLQLNIKAIRRGGFGGAPALFWDPRDNPLVPPAIRCEAESIDQ
ncbi:hypothetical protein CKA56_15580 [Arcobacter venerupis]|nr:hypothetical protein CKA56_15580 [Arcobacter venerupis]